MKTKLKIMAAAALMVLFASGVSFADGWKCEGGPRGHAYGHYKQPVHHHYHYAPPRPVYVEHHYRPVIVERH